MWLWKLTADPAPDQPEVIAALARLFEPPDWERCTGRDINWSIRPEWRQALLDAGNRLRFDAWRAAGRLEIVKQGPHRVVYRVNLPAPHGVVYIKRNRAGTLRARIRQYLRRGKGRNEARRAIRLAALGVNTITPIALGEQRRHGLLRDNFLISPEITGAVPLDKFLANRLPALPAERRAYVRRRLAEALGDLTARLHENNYEHIDFHAGNILVRLDDRCEPSVSMIDLDALRIRKRLDWDTAARNLSLLNHSAWATTARSERQRFLHAYLRGRSTQPPDPRAFARRIEAEARAWAERLWRRTGRRCAGSNKYFATYKGPHAWAVASRDFDPEIVRTLLTDPDAPFRNDDRRLLKDSRTTTVAEVPLPLEGEPKPAIYKRFNRKKWLDPILTLFRPSRGWRAWCNAQHLTVRGVPTPRNLAVIGRMPDRGILPGSLCPHETYLLTLKADPSITLYQYAYEHLPTLPQPERGRRVRALTTALARLIRLLHERSLSHRDLKAANILVEGLDAEPAPRMSLIDLVGVRVEHPLNYRHRVQNLARLHLSLASAPDRTRTVSLRFLRTYLTWSGLPADSWKTLWRDVDRASRHKITQNLRRHRILS